MGYPKEILPSNMKIGDIVRPIEGEQSYSYATVYQIRDDVIYLFRPYTHTSNTIYQWTNLLSRL